MNSVCCVEPWGLPDQVFVCPLGRSGGGGGVSVLLLVRRLRVNWVTCIGSKWKQKLHLSNPKFSLKVCTSVQEHGSLSSTEGMPDDGGQR